VSLTGSASGTVTSTAGGIICPGLCTATLGGGIPVTLTATPLPGAEFREWRGACAGQPATCTLTPVALTTTTAVFKQVFTNDPLVAQSTPIKAAHFTELREAINILRANCQCGLGAFAWSGTAPAPGGAVRAAHLTDLRTALDAAYFKVNNTHLTFESVQAGTTPINASHLTELRNLVRGLE
jgi:List-Bact-rpt repeat protein